jgi:hypothetical protein
LMHGTSSIVRTMDRLRNETGTVICHSLEVRKYHQICPGQDEGRRSRISPV